MDEIYIIFTNHDYQGSDFYAWHDDGTKALEMADEMSLDWTDGISIFRVKRGEKGLSFTNEVYSRSETHRNNSIGVKPSWKEQ